eukprot:436191-Pyramimonas_sp.AAC.1
MQEARWLVGAGLECRRPPAGPRSAPGAVPKAPPGGGPARKRRVGENLGRARVDAALLASIAARAGGRSAECS